MSPKNWTFKFSSKDIELSILETLLKVMLLCEEVSIKPLSEKVPKDPKYSSQTNKQTPRQATTKLTV